MPLNVPKGVVILFPINPCPQSIGSVDALGEGNRTGNFTIAGSGAVKTRIDALVTPVDSACSDGEGIVVGATAPQTEENLRWAGDKGSSLSGICKEVYRSVCADFCSA